MIFQMSLIISSIKKTLNAIATTMKWSVFAAICWFKPLKMSAGSILWTTIYCHAISRIGSNRCQCGLQCNVRSTNTIPVDRNHIKMINHSRHRIVINGKRSVVNSAVQNKCSTMQMIHREFRTSSWYRYAISIARTSPLIIIRCIVYWENWKFFKERATKTSNSNNSWRKKTCIGMSIFTCGKYDGLCDVKKKFDFRILSDGVSVSCQFISPKSEPTKLDLDKVKMDYTNGTIRKVLGIDPGLNKWCSAVQRDIETGKEVSFPFILHTKS